MNINIVTVEDINYLAGQPKDNLNFILSGMTALIDENNENKAMLESQTWFQRMSRTISGKNKMTLAEIQQNHDKINLYIAQSLSELFDRNCMEEQMIVSLGMRLNELYTDHIQLKQMLGVFADKLNQKMTSIDNFHMLETEIEQGLYDRLQPISAVCKILSQLDLRTLSDNRKLDILEKSITEHKIISEDSIAISEHLLSLLNMDMSEVGIVYMEMGTLGDNFVADIFRKTVESYHFLSETAKRFKVKEQVVENVIGQNQLDASATLTLSEIYHEFLDAKIVAASQIGFQERRVAAVEEQNADLKKGIEAFFKYSIEEMTDLLAPLAQEEDGMALYLISFLDYIIGEETVKDYLERGHIAGNPMASVRYAQKCQDNNKTESILKDNIKKVELLAEQGNPFAQYELAVLYSETNKIGLENNDIDIRGLLQKSSEQGNWAATYQLAKCFRYGTDGEVDSEKAFKLFQQLDKVNMPYGTMELADFYMEGIFVEENPKKAEQLLEKALEHGLEGAKCKLAWCYGRTQRKEEAKELYAECFIAEVMMVTSMIIEPEKIDGKAMDTIIHDMSSDGSKRGFYAYDAYQIMLDTGDEYQANMYLRIASIYGNSRALYEYARYSIAKDSDDYEEMFPDEQHSELADYVIPYDLESARYCLEQAKKYTDDEKLLISIEWLEVKIDFKETRDVFEDLGF